MKPGLFLQPILDYISVQIETQPACIDMDRVMLCYRVQANNDLLKSN